MNSKTSLRNVLSNVEGASALLEKKNLCLNTTVNLIRSSARASVRALPAVTFVQLLGYLAKFEEDEGRSGKGILLGNAWKDLPVDERDQKNSVIFPDNVIASAASNSIALVSSVDFFDVFCRFLAGEVTGTAILDRVTSAVGVVSFLDL
jgi:hypothetical protein